MTAPRLFISYSWTSPEREKWVLDLATELRESGVDAILDKWDLKEGHDAHAFMESMVTDSEIKKVVLVCDKKYCDKANKRSGGVGAEAQIISSDIYSKQKQEKFVAIVTENNDDGDPALPVYYKSRIYIDFRDASQYGESFEKLLRWALDKPLLQKPDIGSVPSFLATDEKIYKLLTSAPRRRAVDAIRSGKSIATAATAEYLNCVVAEIEKLRLPPEAENFDELVVKSIEEFLPNRNELIELFITIALYGDNAEYRRALHSFFEELASFLDVPANVMRFYEGYLDNYRFLVHELFLYLIATLIRYERFDFVAHMLGSGYYVARRTDSGKGALANFTIFRRFLQSLDFRKKRLKLNRMSLAADFLKERCAGTSLKFEQLIQADLILFLRGEVEVNDGWVSWWPETCVYAERHRGALEIFARSASRSYFDRIKVMLGVSSKAELNTLFEQFKGGRELPRWNYHSLEVMSLTGFEQIATKN